MKNIFKNKKVLITGNTGFKGSWLSLWMHTLGAKVLGISLGHPSVPSNHRILQLEKKIKFIKADIRNFKKLNYEINKFKPDFIFHLAAEAIVQRAFQNPINVWETNTLGTVNILETIKRLNKNIIAIIITSDKVYKNLEITRGYKEDDMLGSFDPYSASKASADLATKSYFETHLKNNKNVRLCIARAGNVIGGGDWSVGRIVPDCIKNWSQNKTVEIRNPNSTRPWQHVLDVLNGYITLAINVKSKVKLNGEAFNFGPKIEKNRKVIDVVKAIKHRWGNAKWKIYNKEKFPENKLLQLNSNKAKNKLNWRCKLNLKNTIIYTTDWYKEYYTNKKNIYDYSIMQINKFNNIK